MRAGLLLFAWGFFKKVVIAARLAVLVNTVYDNVHAFNGLALIMATYVPCMSAMAVMVKEFGLKDTIKVTLASLAIAFSLGGLAHLLFTMH